MIVSVRERVYVGERERERVCVCEGESVCVACGRDRKCVWREREMEGGGPHESSTRGRSRRERTLASVFYVETRGARECQREGVWAIETIFRGSWARRREECDRLVLVSSW